MERTAPTRTRRCAGLLLALAALPAGAGGAACAPAALPEPPGEPALERRIDAALERGLRALVERQRPDGTWRSERYGALRHGLGLTPSVLKAVLYAGERGAGRRGLDALAACVGEGGSVDAELGYPVYTAALAAIALTQSGSEGDLAARAAWLELLASHQLDEELGWTPDDAAYGGWGYALRPPVRGASGLDADLSSTLFALGALRIAGVPADDPRIVRARRFIARCQNLPLDEAATLDPTLDPELDDGGFFMTPTNDLQNKAGVAGVDATGRTRYRSYGSMTADGLRALLRAGFAPDHPRVVAARAWLARHFDPERNPGAYDPVREVERRSSYYYACWSQAHAFFLIGGGDVGETDLDWARPLAEAMLARQQDDGTWSNPAGAVMEDDPLVATPFALAVLGLCRAELARRARASSAPAARATPRGPGARSPARTPAGTPRRTAPRPAPGSSSGSTRPAR